MENGRGPSRLSAPHPTAIPHRPVAESIVRTSQQRSHPCLSWHSKSTRLNWSWPGAMIGLKRNTVKVVDYDPDWAMPALEGCRVVRNACGELLVEVQHVGSTAVPELPAKPILDIAAALATIDSMPEIVRRLTRIGYLDRGDQGDAGGHVLVLESSPDIRTVHCCRRESCLIILSLIRLL